MDFDAVTLHIACRRCHRPCATPIALLRTNPAALCPDCHAGAPVDLTRIEAGHAIAQARLRDAREALGDSLFEQLLQPLQPTQVPRWDAPPKSPRRARAARQRQADLR